MKTVWIVDGSYLFQSCRAANFRLDYLQLKQFLEEKAGRFTSSYYLDSVPNSASDEQNSFHSWLKCAEPIGPRMRVMLYNLKPVFVQCKECGFQHDKLIQKGVDVGIATLMIKLATQNVYDRLVLTAGDGDFEDAIQYIKEDLHKEFWLAGFERNLSPDLQSYSDYVIRLNEHITDFTRSERF